MVEKARIGGSHPITGQESLRSELRLAAWPLFESSGL